MILIFGLKTIIVPKHLTTPCMGEAAFVILIFGVSTISSPASHDSLPFGLLMMGASLDVHRGGRYHGKKLCVENGHNMLGMCLKAQLTGWVEKSCTSSQ
jgi:hypothetical protein